jgi:hypothetical protein
MACNGMAFIWSFKKIHHFFEKILGGQIHRHDTLHWSFFIEYRKYIKNESKSGVTKGNISNFLEHLNSYHTEHV